MQNESLTRESLAGAAADLARRDEDLARILARRGPPPLWARPAGFSTLIRIVLEQQVSLASAKALFERLTAAAAPVSPGALLSLGEGRLRELGLTRQKTTYCLELARSVEGGELSLRAVAGMNDEEARSALTRMKGIGPWSADVYLLMALRRPDVWPAGDIALAASYMKVKRLRRRPAPEFLVHKAEAWRPWRSVAARMLWQEYLAARAERRLRPA